MKFSIKYSFNRCEEISRNYKWKTLFFVLCLKVMKKYLRTEAMTPLERRQNSRFCR